MATHKASKRTSVSTTKAAKRTVAGQRELQREIDAKDAKRKPKPESKKAVQAGARKQPGRMPAQHLAKPGRESDLALVPRFEAPDYRGSGKLEGMATIVTGADSGIGRAVAVLFAREGADVAILHLDEHEDAEETARWVKKEGRHAIVIAGDVRDSAFCKHAVDKTVKAFGRLDVLVNNAGFQLHADKLEDISDDHLQETLQTNIAGYFYMARAALPHMQAGASIVNTGSVTGLFGSPKLIDYSATKGAIHAFTKALAANLLDRGIRVNAVAPGPVWTPFNPADKPAGKVAEFGKDSAMRRPAQPEELSPAFVFLASPVTASYVNGVVLPVMGGPKG
ncbi:SDR family oxidoreductase [Pseudoluteimonas lycopersici]|uniref:SDR family oxidoreductase n=1 Tax=Pseudoluteimonas lycopersici TaxID=1324796 RepID=UPI00163D6A2A|nr:SDR family oxidoreductase [Lysobacter lycopersici]